MGVNRFPASKKTLPLPFSAISNKSRWVSLLAFLTTILSFERAALMLDPRPTRFLEIHHRAAMRLSAISNGDYIQHISSSDHDGLGALEKASVWGAARTGPQTFVRK